MRLGANLGNGFDRLLGRSQSEALARRATAGGLGGKRDHPEGSEAGDGLCLLGGADGVVHALQEEGQADPGDEAQHQRERQVERKAGLAVGGGDRGSRERGGRDWVVGLRRWIVRPGGWSRHVSRSAEAAPAPPPGVSETIAAATANGSFDWVWR